MSKWIKFEEKFWPGRKTKVFAVTAKTGVHLGYVKWWGPWRRYAFFPDERTAFETQCLTDIVEFINKLMEERKHEKANSSNRIAT
jgi:hypothetical protein